jgi:hypothetical protein
MFEPNNPSRHFALLHFSILGLQFLTFDFQNPGSFVLGQPNLKTQIIEIHGPFNFKNYFLDIYLLLKNLRMGNIF